jgi:hypothetical protein
MFPPPFSAELCTAGNKPGKEVRKIANANKKQFVDKKEEKRVTMYARIKAFFTFYAHYTVTH